MEERDVMQMHGLTGAFSRLRARLIISDITNRVLDTHRSGALMVTYVDGLTNVILRTDVIMGSQTATRKRIEQSLRELWRPGSEFRLVSAQIDRFGGGYRIVRSAH
ncbi:hypothetical protein [Lacticaseibacillus hulanensis]|jgi:hypothetical protein|uniref:hypothetical protein n=1 Tax=Lacticaseibacillus hulanensis TaxID=2493111 RepID=UPI000FD77DBF|nr:hypothetical protein [Lacticaseibacillus hulanensis]